MPADILSAVGVSPAQHSGIVDRIGELASPAAPGAVSGGKSFGQFLADALGEVNDLQTKAGSTVEQFAAGAPMDIHQVMIATEKASTALALTTQIRNKLVDAYTEIIHTQM